MMISGDSLFAMGFNYATFGSLEKSEGAIYEKRNRSHPGNPGNFGLSQ
jgi:hypothetical protein